MPEAVIVGVARTPIGRAFKGSLVHVGPDDLGAQVTQAVLDRLPQLDPRMIDDLILGCGLPGGPQGHNLARVIAVRLGYDHMPGVTVNRFCSSSLQSTRMAMHAIRAGEGDVFLSVGVESVSSLAELSPDADPRSHSPFFRSAEQRTADAATQDAAWEDPRLRGLVPNLYIGMGDTAENVASTWGISRAEQDEFALLSQRRAELSSDTGFWAREIVPVRNEKNELVETDDGPRRATTLEGLAALSPVFRENGTVTAGNACPLNDGAAALVIMSDVKAKELGVQPLARIVSTAATGLSPEIMGMGPVEASRLALARAGMTISDIDIVEMNEAFAVQVIASARELGVDHERLNPFGGAIAMGHPFGMSGARITGTLLNGLRQTDGSIGLETMCVGGGQGMAMVLERLV